MSEALQKRAEITKLARLLGRVPAQLDYLQGVPSADIAALREQVTEVLFRPDGALGRLAAASRLLPVGVVAMMAEKIFGPVLSARVAGLIDPSRAVQLAAKLPTEFLAEIAPELDPRRAHEVISRIPPEEIGAITRILVARDELVAMGRFVGHLDPPAITAAVAAMDDRAMLQIAFVLEDPDGFRDLFGLLSTERLKHVIDTAAAEQLWPETLDLLTRLDDGQRRKLIELAAGRDDAVLDALILAAQAQGLWDLVLPLTALMSRDSLRRFAGLPSLQAKGVLESALDAVAARSELWSQLMPILAAMPDRCRARAAEYVRGLPIDPEELIARAREAGVADLLGPALSA